MTGPAGSGETVLFFKKILDKELSYEEGKEFTFTYVNTCLVHKAVDILQANSIKLAKNNKDQVYNELRQRIKIARLEKALKARVH